MTTTHFLGPTLVALTYSSTLQAQEKVKDYCSDPAFSWPLPYLIRLTQRVDGYQGWSKHLKDGKLSLAELADHRYGELCKYQAGDIEMCAGRKTPERPKRADHLGDTMSQRFAEVGRAHTLVQEEEWLRPFDANRDGYLTPDDDVDNDGYITCQDALKYVPPPKKIKPTKNQPPQPPKTPRRR